MSFYPKTIKKFETIKEQYQIEGAMTLRRIYYVLLGKGLVSNSKYAYDNLSKQLLKARKEHYLDWDIIIDRSRRIEQRQTFESFDEIFETACRTYVKDSMELYQDKHIEIWIEKDAIAGNVTAITWLLDVPVVIGRGWTSGTYIYNLSKRVKEYETKDQVVVVLYLSDFDAEGEHIPKVVERDLKLYGCNPQSFRLKKIALTKPQIKSLNLQSNPAFKFNKKQKKTAYVQEFKKNYGEVQYHIDAMTNIDLEKILVKELKKVIDFDIPKKSDQECREEVKDWLDKHYKK